MRRCRPGFAVTLAVAILAASCAREERIAVPDIVVAPDASRLERIAAAEVRRYLYLLTGGLSSIVEAGSLAGRPGPSIVVSTQGRPLLRALEAGLENVPRLGPEDYWLKTVGLSGVNHLLVAGGEGAGILYGAFAFAETLGVHFELDGDIVPEDKITFAIPEIDETGRPMFAVRGIQPFHDFPEGPDWWRLDNYKAVLGQLPKLGLNFFGLHTYPEKGPNAEPTVWIGGRGEFDADGRVRASYPSSYQTTLRGNWGYEPKKTGDYSCGASLLFDRDDFGNDVMEGFVPEPKPGPDSNEVFNRAASVFRDAFRFARGLGIKTCVGTETPLTVPEFVRKRLAEKGRSSGDPAVVRDLYKGIFERIAAAYPVDYYWLWTWEGWTWSDAKPEEIRKVTSDLEQALKAWQDVRAPFRLATCGWVLGPPSNRTLFDQILPKDVAMSCINREVGKAPVDPTFARIQGRSLWAIPWLEDDPSLTSPQLWAGRMRRDAADALRYGCDGLLGIHWRTRVLSPNVRALARAAWDQSWNTLPRGKGVAAGPSSGRYALLSRREIAGTNEDAIYWDVRDRVFGYRLPVPAGRYTVTLKFVEGEIDRKDGRVFDILLQGRKVAERFDIFARAGRFAAVDLVFRDVAAPAGRVEVEFVDRIHYPCLAGIVLEGENYVQRINCGGLSVVGCEPDWPETPRDLPVLDFYRDWALSEFGESVADEAGGLFNRLDGKLPIPVNWTNGPGGLVPNPRPWAEVRRDYAFVDDFADIGTRLTGTATRARFEVWLRRFEYMREAARFACLWADFNAAMEKVKTAKDKAAKERAAAETALPVRVEMAASLRKIFGCLLASAENVGDLGTIMNWEQHILPTAFERPGEELAKALGGTLPAEARLPSGYDGQPRIIVLAARTSLEKGEDFRIRIGILSRDGAQKADLYWRPLGTRDYKAEPLSFVGRGVYAGSLVSPATDIEYYIKVAADGVETVWPPTAPALSQTAVVYPD
jgi:hypothetical protein